MKFTAILLLLCSTSWQAVADEPRVGLSYSQGAIEHAGDVQGSSGQAGYLGLNVEFLKSSLSSTYHFEYLAISPNSSQNSWLIEKGYYYYPRGATATLHRDLDFRIGLNLGLGKYGMDKVDMQGVYYERMSSVVAEGSAAADILFGAGKNSQISVGGKYMYGGGIQDVLWTFSTFQLTCGFLYHF